MVLVAAGAVRRRRATDDRASSPSASARCVQCSWRGRLPPSRSPARYAALSNVVGAAKASGLIALARTDARLGRVGSRRWRRRGAACCCRIPCHGAAAPASPGVSWLLLLVVCGSDTPRARRARSARPARPRPYGNSILRESGSSRSDSEPARRVVRTRVRTSFPWSTRLHDFAAAPRTLPKTATRGVSKVEGPLERPRAVGRVKRPRRRRAGDPSTRATHRQRLKGTWN